MLVVVGLLGGWLTAPAGAATAAGTIDAVTVSVDDRTPLYNLTFDFALSGVTCPASLDYTVGSSRIEGVPVCGAGGSGPEVLSVQHPVFGESITDLFPDTLYRVRAFVRDSTTTADGATLAYVPVSNGEDVTVGARIERQLRTPKRPIWVGVGDGYTSARNQAATSCWNEGLFGTAACLDADLVDLVLRRNDTDASWIEQAVVKFNAGDNRFRLLGQDIPDEWQVRTFTIDPSTNDFRSTVLAEDTAAAASLAPGGAEDLPGGQLAEMEELLAAHRGSWNWVGLSAGLLDAGIQNAIWARYGGGTPAADGSANGVPQGTYDLYNIALTSGNACPDLSGVVANVNAAAPAITSAIQNVVTRAQAASPGARTMVIEYPFLTEGATDTIVSGARNKCSQDDAADADTVPENREGILRLNEVISDAVFGFLPPEPGRLPLVYAIDLMTGFTDRPAGTTSARSDSYLQLTRPWGYPYPNDGGRGKIGDAAVTAAKGSGEQIPEGTSRIVNPDGTTATPWSGGGNWFNQSNLSVEFSVTKGGTGKTWISSVCWPTRGAVAAGCIENADKNVTTLRAPLVEAKVVQYTATIEDEFGHKVPVNDSASVDHTAPVLLPSVPVDVGGFINADHVPVTVSWGMADVLGATGQAGDMSQPNLSSISMAVTNPSGATSTVSGTSVVLGTSGTWKIQATARDNAGNLTTNVQTVKLDIIKPTITTTKSPNVEWTRDATSVSWAFADEGGSLLANQPPAPAQVDVEGITTVPGPTARDNAGNETVGSPTEVRIDRTAPQIGILFDGAPASPDLTFDITDLPAVTCDPSKIDQPPTDQPTIAVSGLASCTIGAPSSTPVDGGVRFTYTATAIDRAGNVRTTSASFLTNGFLSIADGRFTGGGSVGGGVASVNPNMRCNGSPNQLGVSWRGGSFNMDWTDNLWCWGDPRFDQQQPRAHFNTVFGMGRGTLGNGERASVQWMLTDGGEPGRNDQITISIKDADGVVIFTTSGALSSGNYQAHESQGNGTNNNTCLNGPTGHLRQGQSCSSTAPSPVRW